jgi:16S rRNA (guanine966-N2)-methyltransferase
MRVIGGELRGRRLESPPGDTARPTSDRVREAVFNILTSLGAVDGSTVLDLFAGTGALGIEALSRGATHATFVERDPKLLAPLRRNLDSLGLDDDATVVTGDAGRYARDAVSTGQRFDLAFLDPPYAFDAWDDLLADLPAALVVIESDRPITTSEAWGVLREKRYGGTLVTVARREPTASTGPSGPVA